MEVMEGVINMEMKEDEIESDFYYTEEEEEYILMDFKGKINVRNPLPPYKLIGLDTPTPFIQIGNQIFRGQYDQILGTDITLPAHTTFDKENLNSNDILASFKRLEFLDINVNSKDKERSGWDEEKEEDFEE